ncbi:MFS transporter [Arthrobacter sp. NPDC090010]|uniref:MFS transporter n=1 Tax=Arthrobacter sp. NPDC090010 TaxID=3363942 RepID=UPI0037FA21E6
MNRLSPRQQMRHAAVLALIEGALMATIIAPLAITFPLKVLSLVPASEKEGAISAVSLAGAITALVFFPICGYLSDRTVSRWGRRRPWVVGGAAIGVVGSVIALSSENLATLILSAILIQLGANAGLASVNSMLAERVSDEQRSKASGWFGGAGFMALIPAMLITGSTSQLPVLQFLLIPVLALLLATLGCRWLGEAPATPETAQKARWSEVFSSLLFNPKKQPLFGWLWIQRAVLQLGYMLMGSFGLYYLIVRLHLGPTEAASLTGFSSIASALLGMVAAIAFGYIAARMKSYAPLVIASITAMIVAMGLKAFTADITDYWLALVLSGLALGAYYAVDLALVMRVIPAGEEGRYLGAFNVAKTLPQSVAPALAPLLLLMGNGDPISGGQQNYAAVYVFGGIMAALSFIPLLKLRSILRRDPATTAPQIAPAPASVE